MPEQDGYCGAPAADEVARLRREYDAAERREKSQPSPPLANVGLAVELATGLDSVRDLIYRGQTYRAQPTPYHTAIRLLAWNQQLERLAAIGDLLREHLPELRTTFLELLSLVGSLVEERPNPFRDAEQAELAALVSFALDSGLDYRIPTIRSEDGTPQRYDAAYYLMAYRASFGAMPRTWREFTAGSLYLRRKVAEDALQTFGAAAMAQADGPSRERWIAVQQREAGQV